MRAVAASALMRAAAVAAGMSAAILPAAAETVAGGYLGSAWTRDSDVHVWQPATSSDATFRSVGWDGRSHESPPYYGLRVTHFLERFPQWGIGLDATHYKVYARTDRAVGVNGTWDGAPVDEVAPLDERVQRFDISHGVNYVGPIVAYRWRLGTRNRFPLGRWNPYVGAGPVYYVLHPENTINGVPSGDGYEGSGWGWQAFGGISYRVTPSLSVFGEARYSEGTAKVSTGGGGRARTDLETRHLIFGFGWSF